MGGRIALIGAPSSAGAYAPGQERAPAALRSVGLIDQLEALGVQVDDRGDVPGFRWRADRNLPRAMNANVVAEVAAATANLVAEAVAAGDIPLVIGGDCTVELGTVAGVSRATESIGLIYVDLDTDLNTPESTTDGALDWMGVAHLLGMPNTISQLTALGARQPMLGPDQVLYFGVDNIEPFERDAIRSLGIGTIALSEVAANPSTAAHKAIRWSEPFERLLVHIDLDVLDYLDMPLAENNRRNWGLKFDQLIEALRVFVQAPHWCALTICELNPDHGESDGSTLRTFNRALSTVLAASPALVRRRAAASGGDDEGC